MKILIMSLFLITSLSHATEKPVARTMNDKDLKWGPCPEIFPKGCEISILQGEPEKPGADVYLRVPGNYNIPAHTHTSAEHMILVSGNLEVKYQGENALSLTKGSYAYGPPQHPHRAECTSKEPCVLFISFDAPIDAKAFSGTLK